MVIPAANDLSQQVVFNPSIPDANKDDPDAGKKFGEVQKAYDTLKDAEKRRVYDRVGRENMERMEQGGGPGPGAGPFGGFEGGFEFRGGPFGFEFRGGSPQDLDEIFEQFFGAGPFGAVRRGRDVRAVVELTFMEAVWGTSVSIFHRQAVISSHAPLWTATCLPGPRDTSAAGTKAFM